MSISNVSNRINKFDNLKGLAIILVVIGNLIYLKKTHDLNVIRKFIYLIPIPIFFFVSGYFSKIDIDQPIKSFKRLIIPYIIFCILLWLFNRFVLMGHPKTTTLFIYPGFALWFLISLFFMKMLLPIINKFRYPLIASFILAICIGFFKCKVLGISRTFVYLPIFILGFYYRDYVRTFSEKFKTLYSILTYKKVVLILAALTVLGLLICANNFKFGVISLTNTYAKINLYKISSRLLIICLGIMSTLILTALMTNKETVLTKIGKNSMCVFLLHLFLIKFIKAFLKPYYVSYPALTVIAVVIISFVIAFILSRDIITKVYDKFIDVIFKIFFKGLVPNP